MPLDDELLMLWFRASLAHYDGREVARELPPLSVRDVELASDVATWLPMLYLIPRFLEGQDGPPRYVEIGTADGSTAAPLLKAAAELNGHLHSVDPDRCEDAHRLVHKLGYLAHWTHHQTVSDDFFRTFRERVDFAFVDGDHRWPVIERDVRNLYERLRPGGIIWVSDLCPLRTPYEPYEQEYDGPDYVEHRPGTIHETQSVCGVSKALLRVLPALRPRPQAINLSMHPNPSALVRKPRDNELLGLERP